VGISEYLDWIKLSPRYLLAFALASIFLLMAPHTIIAILGWEKFVTEYKPWIGLVALVSSALLLSHCLAEIAPSIINAIQEKRVLKKCKENLKNLTPKEKLMLSDYILRQTKSRNQDIKDGVVNGLVKARIIYPAARVGDLIRGFAYNLQPWAWEELNKHPEYLEPVLTQRRTELGIK
jgi:hypothetical protein